MPIGFLPGGGTSVLPRALGLPSRSRRGGASRSPKRSSSGATRRITLGRVNGRRFAFNAGLGLDAEAVRRVDGMGRTRRRQATGRPRVRARGRPLRSLRGAATWSRARGEGLGRAAFAFVANGSPYTYAKRLAAADRARGRSSSSGSTSSRPSASGGARSSRRFGGRCSGIPRHGNVLYGHDLDRIEIVCDEPTPLHADGEDLGDVEGRFRGRARRRLGLHLAALRCPAMAQVAQASHELRRVIDEDREVDGLGEQELLDLYRSMVLLRTYDERSVVYHRQGRIGTYAIFWNHEAMQAGSVHALDDEDWIFPSYRESAIGLLRGMPPATVLHWWRGHPAGWWNPADYNVASICVPIATQVPHAAGLAWGKKLKGERACAIAYFGDGATSEGAFHEGANFAGVMQAPLILFCNNNQWAISTPVSAQTRAETLADKAVGYGMPGVRVDGGDVLAVYEATREAVERARTGDGPTFIEACHVPRRAARDRRRSARVHRPRARRAGEEERVPRPLRALSAPARRPRRRARRRRSRPRRPTSMRAGIAAAEAEPDADIGLIFEHAYVEPAARSSGACRAAADSRRRRWLSS